MKNFHKKILITMLIALIANLGYTQVHSLRIAGGLGTMTHNKKAVSVNFDKAGLQTNLSVSWNYIPKENKGLYYEVGLSYTKGQINSFFKQRKEFDFEAPVNANGLVETDLEFQFESYLGTYIQNSKIAYNPNLEVFNDAVSWAGGVKWEESVSKLGIPLLIGYEFGKYKIKGVIQLGVEYGYVTNSKSGFSKFGGESGFENVLLVASPTYPDGFPVYMFPVESLSNSLDIEIKELNRHQFSVLYKMGAKWKVNDRSYCFLNGTYSGALNTISDGIEQKFFLNRLAGEAGLIFKLKKSASKG